jgi:hypothetical protein
MAAVVDGAPELRLDAMEVTPPAAAATTAAAATPLTRVFRITAVLSISPTQHGG